LESKKFRYYAFISYAHEDEKWADWLQKEVENYKLPTTIHKDYANSLPQKVQPLFRDIPDLAAGGRLDNVLKEELEDSNYLIVICSPNSAKSEWVNKEVQHFMNIGREDRIIPFIVSGKPNCSEEDAAQECYPPAIRGRHILGASVDGIADTAGLPGKQKKSVKKQNKAIKDTAKLKVVAGLLSVKLDILIRRHEQEIKKKRRTRAAAASLCAALILSGALFAFDYYVPKVKYYKDYVEIYGAATGIGEIGASERGSLQYSYRITEVKNHVVSLERVDSSGQLLSDELLGYTYEEIDMRPAKIEYDYAGSTLKSALYYSSANKPIVEYSYFDESTIYLKRISPEGDDESTEKYQMKWSCDMVKDMSLNEYEDSVLSYVTGFEIQYDVKGRAVARYYINSNMARDNIVSDIRHVAGEEYSYNSSGRIASISFIDKEGERTFIFENGISSIEFDYSDDTTEVEYLNIKGEPVKNEYYKIIIDESKKREKTITFYNYEGETVGTQHMFFSKSYQLEKQIFSGNIFGENSCNTVLYSYADDKLSQITKYDGEFLDESILEEAYGEPKRQYPAFESYMYEYDDNGNVETMLVYEYGGLVLQKTMEYYSNNYLKSEYDEKHDDSGEPAEYKTTYTYEYGAIKEITSESTTGTEGVDGYSKKEYSYDKLGNLTGIKYSGADGSAINIDAGYAEYICTYDLFGQLLTAEYYDEKGSPVQGDEYMAYSAEKDRNDVIISEHYKGYLEGSNSIINKYIEYDELGNVLSIKYTDESERLVPVGNASYYKAVREDGRITMETYLDYFPATPEILPYFVSDRLPEVRVFYDDNYRIESVTALDEYGSIVLEQEYTDGKISAATIINHSTAIYGKVIPVCIREFNEYGKMTSEAFFDEDGNLTLGDYCAIQESIYDGRVLKERIYYFYNSKYFELVKQYIKTYNEAGFVSHEKYVDMNDAVIFEFDVDSDVNLKFDGSYKEGSESSFLDYGGAHCTTVNIKIVSGDGEVIIDGRYNFNKEGLTAADALIAVLDENDITYTLNGDYLNQIGGLTNENQAAWNYTVNGEEGNNFITRYLLEDDDQLVLTYLIYSDYY